MTPERLHHPVSGIVFCVGALLAFAVQDSIVKALSARYPVLEILALRAALVLSVLCTVGLLVHGPGILKSSQPKPMLARGVLAFLAFTSYYLALSQIPLADAATVYMTGPLFVTILSIPLLGEHVGWHRWAAVLLGFVSVLVMLNPGSELFRAEAAIPLFSALCYAMIPILNRRIGLSEHAITMGIYTTAVYLLLVCIVAVVVNTWPLAAPDSRILQNLFQPWSWMTNEDYLLTATSGIIFTAALLSITQAYRIAIVSSVTPFEYTYLIWASLLGYLAFGDVPDTRTVFGGLAVVLCGCYVIYRERTRPTDGAKP